MFFQLWNKTKMFYPNLQYGFLKHRIWLELHMALILNVKPQTWGYRLPIVMNKSELYAFLFFFIHVHFTITFKYLYILNC